MLVTQGSKFKSAEALVAYAKKNPGRLNYATVGPGSLPHLAALDFAAAAKIDISHIPYQGEAPAITDLLGGHVDLYFGTNDVATTHNLRRLGVVAAARQSEASDTPTRTELGYTVLRSISGGVLEGKRDRQGNRVGGRVENRGRRIIEKKKDKNRT